MTTTENTKLCNATYEEKQSAAIAYRDERRSGSGVHPLDRDGGHRAAHGDRSMGETRMRAAQDAMTQCDIRGLEYDSVRGAILALGWRLEGDLA